MSIGGVNPIEWVFPPLALTHAALDVGSKAVTGENFFNTPGSAGAKQKEKQAAEQQRLSVSQELAADRARQEEASRPFTPQQELQSRDRLLSATDFLTGRKRQTLG